MAVPDAAYHPLMRELTTALRRRCGVGEGARLVVACSGGADSVAAVRAVRLLAPRRRWRLEVRAVHVQHGLRGEAAEGDAAFVAALAGRFDVPFERRDVVLPDPERNVEAQARRARYAALAEAAEAAGASHVVTGQHADDQLETLLLALVRGRGQNPRRLRGMAWDRPILPGSGVRLIRPMLGVTRVDVLDFLKTLDQDWREDHTNADPTRPRNRLRRDVLPVLRELNPSVARSTAALAERLRRRL